MVKIRYLIWDDWNVEHIARHGVAPQEVREVCASRESWHRKGRHGRRYILGQTEDGHYLKELPAFQSLEEEAKFWDTHSLADYWDELEDEETSFEPQEDSCPRCGGRMSLRLFDVNLAGGRLILRQLGVYFCPTPGCGEVRLTAKAKAELAEITTLLCHSDIENLVLKAAQAV